VRSERECKRAGFLWNFMDSRLRGNDGDGGADGERMGRGAGADGERWGADGELLQMGRQSKDVTPAEAQAEREFPRRLSGPALGVASSFSVSAGLRRHALRKKRNFFWPILECC